MLHMLKTSSKRIRLHRSYLKSILCGIWFILFRWHQRIHLYIYTIALIIASLTSYYKPFGLLYNIKHIVSESSSTISIRNHLIDQQKQEQKTAYKWLDNLLQYSKNYSNIISNETEQSRFYDFIQMINIDSQSSSYKLIDQPKKFKAHNHTDHILISILYGRQDTNQDDGKFYVGQVLYHLLKNYHKRFIITLCENNNSYEDLSDDIKLLRRIVPVFSVNTNSFETITNMYENEKQAHLQCILANFRSFPNINYFLLLQDDAQPIDDYFYENFLSLIDNRIKQQWPLNGYRKQPAFLKIYHPRWLLDYFHPSIYIIIQLFATSLGLTFLLFISIYYSSRHKNSKTIDLTTNINICHIVFYFLLTIFILILLNHSNVSWTWRSIHPSFYAIYPAPSCCLPGVLYFRETYAQVIDYLNNVKCHEKYAIDTAFDDLPKRIDLKTYLVEPNLIRHIGLYSRLRHIYINPFLLD